MPNTENTTVVAPVATVAARPANPRAKRAASAPKLIKPAKPAAKPVDAKPVAAAPAKPAIRVERTAATIVAQRTNFGELSDRDGAYMRFFATFAKAARNGVVTLAAIVESGKRPAYNGSNKPHDAGVVNRLVKAGFIQHDADGKSFRFTKAGQQRAEYTKA